MSSTITFTPSTYHSGVELIYSPEWLTIFRSRAFKITAEIITLLALVSAATVWLFASPVI